MHKMMLLFLMIVSTGLIGSVMVIMVMIIRMVTLVSQ
jgi:hypothetical protein